MTLRHDFLWGAATSGHQIEGNNVSSDWWQWENDGSGRVAERSGDACDSYHRYGEDMSLLADAGLNAYRFSLEWARIEPVAGEFSLAELAHYRAMIDAAKARGLEPVVTLHHFTSPAWFSNRGGFGADDGVVLFTRYVEFCSRILGDVAWVVTINEPNILNLIVGNDPGAGAWGPDPVFGERLAEAHKAAVDVVRSHTDAAVGWSVAQQALVPAPRAHEAFERAVWRWEDLYLTAGRGDDFIGVQSYTSQLVDENGVVAHPPSPDNTLTGWAYRPDALEMCLRRAWDVGGGVPLMVTENGIATDDDRRRIDYTARALEGLAACVRDGIDVRGYLHWSALDNYEWGHWAPTFGLIAVDRTTFKRTPKPSLAWLGDLARRGLEGGGDTVAL